MMLTMVRVTRQELSITWSGAPARRHLWRSTPLPGRVAGLLCTIGFDQTPIGLGWFVIEMDPADRVDAWQALSDTQPVGDPLGLKQGFNIEVELEVGLG